MSFRHEARRSNEVVIVVADRAQARLYHAPWPELEPIEEGEACVHPESRLREHDTVSDKPGRFRTPAGQRASTDNETDFRHRTADRFAAELVERLELGRNQQQFGRIALVAPAMFLGTLRQALPAELAQMVVAEVGKELVQSSPEEVVSHVREALQAAKGS